MTLKQYLGLVGFLFVGAWVAFDLGDAVLCLIGAAVFALIGAVLQGEIDLNAVQTRITQQPRRQ